jgi:D-alanine transaminase
MLVYLNGDFLDAKDAMVPVTDRGFVFGDGVYEVWRVVRGALFESARHHARLRRGLRELELGTPPGVDPDALRRIAIRLLEANALTRDEATLYLQVTRGAAPRTHYFPPAGTPPTVYIAAAAFSAPDALRATGASAITLPDIRWARCDLKTIQLLPNVLGKQRARERGAIESLFVRDGWLTEGSHCSLFGVVDGTLRTHPANDAILPGVTREVILELATARGLRVREEALTTEEIPGLEELFIAGTTMDVMPIITLDDRPVGPGVPGPITTALFTGLRARLDAAAPSIG